MADVPKSVAGAAAGVAGSVAVFFGAPNENVGVALFGSLLATPKENFGFSALGLFSSTALDPKIGAAAGSDGALDVDTPNENFGAVVSSADVVGAEGALGFGFSQAGHFATLASFWIIQMSQVHFDAAAAFCFFIKSANPPVTSGFGGSGWLTTGAAAAVESLGACGLGASHAGHFGTDLSLEMQQMSQVYLSDFGAAFQNELKSPVGFGTSYCKIVFSVGNPVIITFGSSADLLWFVSGSFALDFCFANKSPKPLFTSALSAFSLGFSGVFSVDSLGFSVSSILSG